MSEPDDRTSFTPVLTTPDGRTEIGNATLIGEYGDEEVRIMLVVGSCTAFGSGQLHLTVADPGAAEMTNTVLAAAVRGSVLATDDSTGTTHAGLAAVVGRDVMLFDSTYREWTPTDPFTLAAGDTLRVLIARHG